MGSELRIVPDVAGAAADLVSAEIVRAAERGSCRLNLSGGSTPLAMFHLLAERTHLPWEQVWIVWGDERYVPFDDERSNRRAAHEALLDRVPIPRDQILPWPTDLATPELAAERFAAKLDRTMPGPIRFDVTLLGLGADAHTASLFPGTGAALTAGTTVVVRPESSETVRLSMTAATLSSSRTVAFLVAGESKRAALEATLAGEGHRDRYPARAIRPGRLLWITDLERIGV
jgi:6-phosphogluconolactonase